MQATYYRDGRMSKHLYYTDDNGRDHKVSGRPKLTGLNMTEWWWLQEVMENQKCTYKSSGFNEVWETEVTTPAGDIYEIGEFSEIVMWVKKLPKVAIKKKQ